MGKPQQKPKQPRLRLAILTEDGEVELGIFPLGPAPAAALRDSGRSWLRVVPRFSLERGQGVCRVIFEHEPALFLQRAGMDLIDWLLRNPDQPIHPVTLLARAAGQPPLQQRSAALDDAKATQDHLDTKAQAEATLEGEETSEVEKKEAQAELLELEDSEAEIFHRTRDNARKVALGVRQSIRRAIDSLTEARDKQGRPDGVLRAFGAHLQEYLFDASRPGAVPPGFLVYRPPADVKWG
jgi:hypothetical protein